MNVNYDNYEYFTLIGKLNKPKLDVFKYLNLLPQYNFHIFSLQNVSRSEVLVLVKLQTFEKNENPTANGLFSCLPLDTALQLSRQALSPEQHYLFISYLVYRLPPFPASFLSSSLLLLYSM